MKITSLQSENVKRLKAVELDVDGKATVVVGGMNAQGKSSLLDSIEYCLAGKSSIPSEPIRHGEEEARIILETDEYRIKRTFKGGKSTLVVESLDGAKYSSPQKLLDKLVGDFTFDPLAFRRKKPKEQLAMLQSLVGLDFTELDEKKKSAYESRTDVNREIKAVKANMEGLPKNPPEPVSIKELLKQVEEMRERNMHNQEAREHCHRLWVTAEASRRNLAQVEQNIEALRQQLEEAEGDADRIRKDIAHSSQLHQEMKPEVDAIEDEDPSELLAQIDKAEEINREAVKGEERKELGAHLMKLEEVAASYTKRIADIDKEKADAMAAAEFPVENLTFNEEGVLLNGLPFEQASSAERWKVSVAMGFAMNPELKIMLIRDGSLLDPASMKVLSEMAEAEGGQVWVERVSDGDECTVVIEDGSIKE